MSKMPFNINFFCLIPLSTARFLHFSVGQKYSNIESPIKNIIPHEGAIRQGSGHLAYSIAPFNEKMGVYGAMGYQIIFEKEV